MNRGGPKYTDGIIKIIHVGERFYSKVVSKKYTIFSDNKFSQIHEYWKIYSQILIEFFEGS